ncbi:MAG: sulfatase-like hydrolase/transferase [Planctomycetaceae bacterium]|nr:sulfatase-like hydrolase/transferase [Planctomycetaceae bacterium]
MKHLFILLMAWTTLCGSVHAADRQPNIIFLLTDDQGWGDAAAWGHPYYKTPNLDRLTQESRRFGQFYVANPVCSPSRTAFMTGCYPARFRVHGHFATHEQNEARAMPDWLDPQVMTPTRKSSSV